MKLMSTIVVIICTAFFVLVLVEALRDEGRKCQTVGRDALPVEMWRCQ